MTNMCVLFIHTYCCHHRLVVDMLPASTPVSVCVKLRDMAGKARPRRGERRCLSYRGSLYVTALVSLLTLLRLPRAQAFFTAISTTRRHCNKGGDMFKVRGTNGVTRIGDAARIGSSSRKRRRMGRCRSHREATARMMVAGNDHTRSVEEEWPFHKSRYRKCMNRKQQYQYNCSICIWDTVWVYEQQYTLSRRYHY